jgi:hypothetical protein
MGQIFIKIGMTKQGPSPWTSTVISRASSSMTEYVQVSKISAMNYAQHQTNRWVQA